MQCYRVFAAKALDDGDHLPSELPHDSAECATAGDFFLRLKCKLTYHIEDARDNKVVLRDMLVRFGKHVRVLLRGRSYIPRPIAHLGRRFLWRGARFASGDNEELNSRK